MYIPEGISLSGFCSSIKKEATPLLIVLCSWDSSLSNHIFIFSQHKEEAYTQYTCTQNLVAVARESAYRAGCWLYHGCRKHRAWRCVCVPRMKLAERLQHRATVGARVREMYSTPLDTEERIHQTDRTRSEVRGLQQTAREGCLPWLGTMQP